MQKLPFVFVDVYAWVMACHTHQTLVMEGIFRHGEFLGKIAQPAVYLGEHEDDIPIQAQILLEKYLGKPILIFRKVSELLNLGCRCWVSLAVDFPSPLLLIKTPFPKVCILHDTMAGEGTFGGPKRKLFELGAKHNDIFAYVSVTALSAFCSERFAGDRNPKAQFIPYGNFHGFDTLPEVNRSTHRAQLVSVFSLFRRKNVEASMQLAENLGCGFIHAGGNREYDEEWIKEQNKKPRVCFSGFVADQFLTSVYGTARYFCCLSSDEGFSIPPLEAIINGVPQIILSPISAHKELYGDYCVNFIRPQDVKKVHSLLFSIKENERHELFSRFHREKVSQALIDYLANL